MKHNRGLSNPVLTGLVAAMLVLPGLVSAATTLNPPPVVFKNGKSAGFGVASRGWSDPAFSGQGWTHFSQWGQFNAKKGQIVTIKIVSQNPSLHPGVTVWYRPDKDRGNRRKGLNYVPDHFYGQTIDFSQKNATDEETKKKLGSINMKYEANGYDADGNQPGLTVQEQLGNSKINPIADGIPGTLVLQFKAPKKGRYQFATGGVNPYPDLLPSTFSAKYPVTVMININKP